MNIHKLSLLLVMGCFIVFGAGNAMAVVLFSDNFNAENGGAQTMNYFGFAKWSVTEGSVDLLGPNYFSLPGDGMFLDMDGSTSSAGRLESIILFDLTPGTYTLQFSLAGNQRGGSDSMTVSLGSVFSEVFSKSSGQPWDIISRTFSVTGSGEAGKLVFDHAGSDNVGMLLDNVSLERAAVPIPGAAILLGSGLAALAGLRRKILG